MAVLVANMFPGAINSAGSHLKTLYGLGPGYLRDHLISTHSVWSGKMGMFWVPSAKECFDSIIESLQSFVLNFILSF